MKYDKSLVLKMIKEIVKKLDPAAEVILYGSRARGDEKPDSDWDILILVDNKADLYYESQFRHRLYDIELETGAVLSVFVHNKEEWKSLHWMTPLYKNIAREGLRI